jgi:hypothetical protein
MDQQARELSWRNRRVLAHRLGWPDEVLSTCERLDALHPDWSVWWYPAPGLGRPAGFCASMPDGESRRRASGGWEQPTVYGATPDQLEESIAAMEKTIAAERAEVERRRVAWRTWAR